MVVDGFDDNLPENQFANSRKCAAYKATKDADYTTFKDADPNRRRYKFKDTMTEKQLEDGDKVKDYCGGGGEGTKVYLYHVKNADAVMQNGANVEVERRGPWIWQTYSRQYYVNFLKDGVERETGAGRSWDVLDEEATKKACPKCSTKDLCTGWPEPKDKMSYPTSDMCIKGTVEGDADYNTITTMSLANQIFHSSFVLTPEYIQKWTQGHKSTTSDESLVASLSSGALNSAYGPGASLGTNDGPGKGGKQSVYMGMATSIMAFSLPATMNPFGLNNAGLTLLGFKKAYGSGKLDAGANVGDTNWAAASSTLIAKAKASIRIKSDYNKSCIAQ